MVSIFHLIVHGTAFNWWETGSPLLHVKVTEVLRHGGATITAVLHRCHYPDVKLVLNVVKTSYENVTVKLTYK